MALERQVSPLPIGRYWKMIEGQDLILEWGEWVKDMGKALQVEMTEETPGHLFTIFRVKSNSVFLNAEQFGYPNKAPLSVKNEEDVVQKPDIKTHDTADVLQGLITIGKVTAVTVVGAVLYSILRKR